MSLALVPVSSASRPVTDVILSRADAAGASVPCLFLGNADAAKDADLLKTLGITHVVTAAFGNPDPAHDVGAVHGDFVYHEVQISDSSKTSLSPYLEPCADFIRDALAAPQNRVFVHCMMGTSRSVSLTLFYMMRDMQYSLRDALLHIMHQRSSNPHAPYTHPNQGFMRQLIACERKMSPSGEASLDLADCQQGGQFFSGENVSHGPVAPPTARHRAAAGSAGATAEADSQK
jgi:atypical dual specificity phosphatase